MQQAQDKAYSLQFIASKNVFVTTVLPKPQWPMHKAALISVSVAFSQTQAYSTGPQMVSASRGVPVYSPAFVIAHWARLPMQGGQDETTWVAGYISQRSPILGPMGQFNFWLSISLRQTFAELKFGLSTDLSQKVKWFHWANR